MSKTWLPISNFTVIDALLISTACIWGLNVVIVKQALASISPLSFIAVRFLIASCCSWALLRWKEPIRTYHPGDWPKFVWLGITAHALQQILFITGINLTTAGNTSLIQATSPIWVAIMAGLMGQERLKVKTLVGIALSIIGILFVTAGGGQQISFTLATTRGNAIILLSAVVFAYGTYKSKSLLTRYSPLQVSTYSITAGAVVLALFSTPTLLNQDWLSVRGSGWGGIFYSAILASVLGYYIWTQGVQKLGSTRTAIYGNLSPLIAMLAGWGLLQEHLTPLQLLGATCIIAGIYVSRTARTRPHPSPHHLTP